MKGGGLGSRRGLGECRGVTRPRALCFATEAGSEAELSHACLRKLAVLSSRGADFQASQRYLLQIAQVRLHTCPPPPFLPRTPLGAQLL